MFKKLLLSSVVSFFAFATYAQTIVSTSPQDKNVVLEEFTGIHCVYCPDGHAIAQSIQDAHPDRVSLINIHTGSFAAPGTGEPDFRTPFGNAIAAQSGLTGYPAGQVNRHVFPGRGMSSGSTAMGRGAWTQSANNILAMPSYVNIAVAADVDPQTNMMNIHVEAYYTADSPESTNLLNVVLIQNNTRGPQTGGNQGNNYNHMHRLVDMVTGQWGEEITPTTAGTFIERDYSYPMLPHNNNVPVEVGDVEIVVFMSETHQEIPSGDRVLPTIDVIYSHDAFVRYVEDFPTECPGEELTFVPRVNIQNGGSDPITSLEITYSLNGNSDTFSWTGNIPSLKSQTIALPEVSTTLLASNTFEVSIPNDDYNGNNVLTIPFGTPETSGTLDLRIKTDNWGNECRWNIKDSDGTIIARGGPYGNNENIYERIYVDADCFTFTLIDTGGDGGNVVSLKDHEGVVIYETNGNYGAFELTKFVSDGILGVTQNEMEDISIYPNPARDILNISNAESADIQVYDILGKLILSKENLSVNEELNVSSLQAGAYFIKISKGDAVTTKKFLISK